MAVLPHHSETLVLAISEKEIRDRLYRVVWPLSDNQPMAADKEENDFTFNGQVRKGCFSISRRIRYSNSFLPIVNGMVEETKNGSIVTLSFSLFPATKAFLWFWLIVSFMITAIFLYTKEFAYSSLGLASGIFCFVVARVSFRRALDETRKHLLMVFD
jgi:hypothetical protein